MREQRSMAGRGRVASRSATAVLAAVMAVTAAGTAAAQTAPPTDVPLAEGLPVASSEKFTGKVADRVLGASGPTAVFIELAEEPAIDVYSAAVRDGQSETEAAATASEAADVSDETSSEVVETLEAAGAAPEEIFRTSNAVSGVAVTADAERVQEIADSADVVKIYPLTPKTVENSNAGVLTNTLKTWQDTGLLGEDMRVGIIDTGIDYTHADFGGPGTVEAFDAVDETTVEGSGYPTDKVVGGIDLVGNAYDASAEDGSPALVPQPDDNPIDCNNHGSHVAGTSGGFGVNDDGSTFTGDYRELDEESLQEMKIGPGMAPKALLYAIKVFGCEGSTNVTAQALDWSLDPDGDKNFSDRLDVINLSLGSSFGAPDDPENRFVQKLSDNGVLSVFSAGNSGDVNNSAGTPGNSPSALTVASSKDSYVLRDGAEVTAPADLAGVKAGQYSQGYSFEESGDLDATPVVALTQADNLDGCDPFSAEDAALVEGKIVWLEWAEEGRRCGSGGRTTNASDAGAVGSVFSSTVNQFGAGLAGNDVIPVFQFTADDTDALRPAVEDGTLEVSMRGELTTSVPSYFPEISDTLSSFSSRGGRAPVVKPDVTAPGDTIASALSGSGNETLVISGTSMAAPHTAGIATLVREKHPDWSVEEVKAAVMNTAGTKLSKTDNGEGPFYGPQRVGTGRIDASAATATNVLAFVKDDPGFVSTSFGVVEVGAETATATKTVTVVNKGNAPQTMTVGYDPRTEQPGVAYSVTAAGGGDTITLSPRGVAEVTVTMTAEPKALRKALDPTMEAEQIGLARQYTADASGNLVLTSQSETQGPLLVPVYSAAKPVSDMSGPEALVVPEGQTQAVLNLTGRGLNQGEGSEAYRSLVTALQLTGTSPELPVCSEDVTTDCTVNGTATGADIRYVGAASTAPLAVASGAPEGALLAFGFNTWGPIPNLGNVNVPFVDIDATGDGTPDFEIFVDKPDDTDVLLATTIELASGDNEIIAQVPVNGAFGDVDTNIFDTNSLVLAVPHAALGVDPAGGPTPVTFSAGISSAYTAPGSDSSTLDSIADMNFDVNAPALSVQGGGDPAIAYVEAPGTALVVNRNAETAAAQDATELLLLHHHNAEGDQAEVIEVTGSDAPVTPPS